MKKWKRIAVWLMITVMLVESMFSQKEVAAKTVAKHTIYSSKTVEKRLAQIRYYYYKKPNKLTVKKYTEKNYNEKRKYLCYFKGNDLMFIYETCGKTEYRLYFYKSQLIEMYVDKPGKKRKIYKQLYRKLGKVGMSFSLNEYMCNEIFGRKILGLRAKKTNAVVTNQRVLITKITSSYIIYHKLDSYGSDGYLWSIQKKAYRAKFASNLQVLDYSNSPDDYIKHSKKWLLQNNDWYLGMTCDLSQKNGKVAKIQIPYWA